MAAAAFLQAILPFVASGVLAGGAAELHNHGAPDIARKETKGLVFLSFVVASIAMAALAYFVSLPIAIGASVGAMISYYKGETPLQNLAAAITGGVLGYLFTPLIPLSPAVVRVV